MKIIPFLFGPGGVELVCDAKSQGFRSEKEGKNYAE